MNADSDFCDECFKDLKYEGSDGKFYSQIIGIEDPYLYDGVSYWRCPFCKTTWDRWDGHIVSDAERSNRHERAKNPGRFHKWH